MGVGFMALFLSTTVNKVDKKGRVSVPASYRTALADGVVLFRAIGHPAIEGWTVQKLEELTRGIEQQYNPFSGQRDDFTYSILADAVHLTFDTEGRIVVPDRLLAHAKIDEAAAFVGKGFTFQIWEPGAFESLQEQARKRAETAREELKLPGGAHG